MFVDYDNLHSVLTAQTSTDHRISTYVLELIDEVRRYLEEGDDTPTVYGRAYGAFDTRLKDDGEVPSRLDRAGFEPRYVSAAMQRNASELQLAMDATQFLADRGDVGTLVIVTGNRPYLPLARRVREAGRRALVAAVNPPQDPDAPAHAEDDLYLDARNLLSQDSREDLLANAPTNGRAGDGTAAVPPQRYQPLTDAILRRTVAIADTHFGQYEEIYLTPLLRKLSEVLGPNHDPKALVSKLEAAGAARLEKRDGDPFDYTVLIFNDDHPDVQDIRAGADSAPSSPLREEASEPSSGEATAEAPAAEAPDAEPTVDYDAHDMDAALAADEAGPSDEAITAESDEEASPDADAPEASSDPADDSPSAANAS